MKPDWTDPAEIRGRLRFVGWAGLAFSLVAWVGSFWPFDDVIDRMGTPLGADFRCFYIAGRMVLDGRTDELYDPRVAYDELHKLFPDGDRRESLPYRYPPFVAAVVAPLALLSYGVAWGIFTALSLTMLVVAVRLLAAQLSTLRDDATWRATFWIALFGWPVVWEVVLGGQWSLFTLAIVAGTTRLLSLQRPVAAGGVLALAAFKPTVLLYFAAGLLLRYPQMFLGAVPVGLALSGASWLVVGTDGLQEYAALGSKLAGGSWDVPIDAQKFQDLLPLVSQIVPGFGRTLLMACGVVSVVVVVWMHRRGRNDALLYSALLAINVSAGTYIPIYDLVLLVPAVLFGIAGVQQCGKPVSARDLILMQVVVAWAYFGPHLSQGMYPTLGLQVFPIVWLIVVVATMTTIFRHQTRPEA